MSALTERDTNVQPTSHPTATEKQNVVKDENGWQDKEQQHKQVIESKGTADNGYGYGQAHNRATAH